MSKEAVGQQIIHQFISYILGYNVESNKLSYSYKEIKIFKH